MFVTSTGTGFSFTNRPNSYCILTSSAKHHDPTPNKHFHSPETQHTNSTIELHMPRNNNSAFPSIVTGAECRVRLYMFVSVSVTVGLLFLADGSVKQHHVTFKYFFHEWLPTQNHEFPWFRPNYFVFRLSQSRAWCCQVAGLVLLELLLRTPLPLRVLSGSSCTVLSGSIA